MADAARAQRQKALEEKKKRLEELKARRTQRASNFVSAQDAAKAKIAASPNLDKYIDGLLKVPNANNPVAGGAATNSGTAGASYSYSYSAHNPTGENGTAGAGFESGSKKIGIGVVLRTPGGRRRFLFHPASDPAGRGSGGQDGDV